jgi:type IV pilus assembly protein PilM
MTGTDIPRLACELSTDAAIAARAHDSGVVDMLSARKIVPGALVPGLAPGNLANPAAVRECVVDALAAVSPKGRDVIVIVPDAAVRVVLLDFDSLPDKREDADPVVRFRLKKSLPFEVDEAALSYDARRVNGNIMAVAAVMPRAVLDEYESVFREAGYNPGVVVPSMLAALGRVQAAEPTLVLKVDALTTSVAIVRGNDLLLYRTLENRRGADVPATELAEDIYPSLVFFQDAYGGAVSRILLAGIVSTKQIGAALEAQTGAPVADLVGSGEGAQGGGLPASMTAPVLGALAANP